MKIIADQEIPHLTLFSNSQNELIALPEEEITITVIPGELYRIDNDGLL